MDLHPIKERVKTVLVDSCYSSGLMGHLARIQTYLLPVLVGFIPSLHRWLKNDTSSVAIPTHYYKIILRCDTNKKPYYKVPGCEGRLDVISFIFPHLPKRPCAQVSPMQQKKLSSY